MDLKEETINVNRHPWELSRTYNIITIYKQLHMKGKIVADIGAGDRYFDHQLLSGTNAPSKIYSIDINYDMETETDARIVLLKNVSLLPTQSIDMIFMMDVMEHVKDDRDFLKLVLTKLKDDGILIVTVPAFQNLFSNHDRFLRHYRRYSRTQLQQLTSGENISIMYSYYFYTTLYFVRWLQLKFERGKTANKNSGVGYWSYATGHFLTKTVKLILDLDFRVNRYFQKWGITFPGLSLLMVCKKY